MSIEGGIARVAAAEVAPDTYVVRATGPFDADTAGDLRDALFPIVAAEGAHVMLDLGDALQIDRASLQVIASAARFARRRGDDLSVVTRDPALSVGLAGLVSFHNSVRGWFTQ